MFHFARSLPPYTLVACMVLYLLSFVISPMKIGKRSLRTADVSPRIAAGRTFREMSITGDERGETSAVRKRRKRSLEPGSALGEKRKETGWNRKNIGEGSEPMAVLWGGGKGTWRPRSQTSFRIPSSVSCSCVLVKRWLPSSKMAVILSCYAYAK